MNGIPDEPAPTPVPQQLSLQYSRLAVPLSPRLALALDVALTAAVVGVLAAGAWLLMDHTPDMFEPWSPEWGRHISRGGFPATAVFCLAHVSALFAVLLGIPAVVGLKGSGRLVRASVLAVGLLIVSGAAVVLWIR